MRITGFRRFGYYFSIATLVGLVWLSQGPANLPAGPEVALAAGDPVIAAAGDIACDPSNSNFNAGNGSSSSCRQRYTSDLLVNQSLAAVLLLGDNQYYCGGYQAWLQSYDLSWGRVKSITRPSVGNHEYLTSGGTDCTNANSGAAGYFRYFGSAAGSPSQGYYSFNIGAWHLIALNSNCSNAGGCGSSSPQGQWLQQDLAANSNLCTLAFWHIPLFSSGGRASSNTQSIWQTLYNNNVDVILNGHDHIYERFAPQAPSGTLDTARGLREFIVGTGGANHTSLANIAANSELRNTDTFGVLKLTLHPTSYDWQFVPEAGKTFSDSGTGLCHGSGQTVPTSTPTSTPTSISVSTSTPTPTGRIPTQPGIGPTTTTTFGPVADSYISETSPTTNYGASNMLRTDGSPLVRSYMRFDVQNLVGRVTRATLRIYANSSLSVGYDVRSVSSNTWGEMAINYNNAPPFGTTVGTSGPITSGQWTSVDITSLITGNGTYNLAITSSSSTALSLASREAIAANKPYLLVETQTDSTPTPTPTSTSTSAATPTFTGTSTPTSTGTSTPTAAPTATATPTQSSTATPTPTVAQLATETPTPTDTETATQTPTSSDPATATPTFANPQTETPTPADTETPTPSGPATETPIPTDTGTPTATSSGLATETLTPTASDPATDTPMPTVTESSTPTSSDPGSNTPTPTDTATPTFADPATVTATLTETQTPTAVPTPTATGVSTPTATATNAPVPTSTPTATQTPAARTFSFTPAADAYVNESSPTTNYGTATQLRIDGSPLVRSFIRFNIQNVTGRITRVTLRVYANSSSSAGYDVRNVTSSWSESTLTFNNAPPFGSVISSSSPFNGGAWTTVDLTSLVTGNGTYNIALTTASGTAVSFSSQSGANAPQLIIETAP